MPAKNTDQSPVLSAAMFGSTTEAEASHYDVLIVPSDDRWNDFGYKVFADIGLRAESGSVEWLPARVAVQNESNLLDFIKRRLSSSPGGIPISQLEMPFASLLLESKYYGMARRVIGLERAKPLLMLVNDIALLREAGESVPNWPDFFTSEVFNLSMLRSSEAYYSLRNGAWELAGRQTADVDSKKPFSIELKGKGPKTVFDFRFDNHNVFRGRIAVIIGPNGCGKTSSLSKIARGLVDLKSREVSIAERPEVNQVLAYAHTASLSLFIPKPRTQGSANVRVFALDPLVSRRHRQKVSDTQLLVDIARAHDEKGQPLLTLLTDTLEEEFPELQVLIPVDGALNATYRDSKKKSYRTLGSWTKGSGEKQVLEAIGKVDHTRKIQYLGSDGRPRTPSLGQLTFIRFLLTALANAGPASVFVIDEPENFLHPNLVSRFMRVLNKVLKSTYSIAIVATHSPFVVREVQSAQVHILKPLADGTLGVGKPLLQTLGSNVASISNEVFGDDLPQHLYEDFLKQAQAENLPFHILLDKYSNDLSTEALMLLRSRMESTS